MGINHLAHFALTLELLPLLHSSAKACPLGARIINISSLLHILAHLHVDDLHLRQQYSAATAYCNSKCAQILFTRELRRRVAGGSVHVFALHPGEVLTDIARTIPGWLFKAQKMLMPLFLFDTKQGAMQLIMSTVLRSLQVPNSDCN